MTVISLDDYLTAEAWAACVRPRLYLYTVLTAGDKDALRHAIALSDLVHLAASPSFDVSYQFCIMQ